MQPNDVEKIDYSYRATHARTDARTHAAIDRSSSERITGCYCCDMFSRRNVRRCYFVLNTLLVLLLLLLKLVAHDSIPALCMVDTVQTTPEDNNMAAW